MMRTVFLACSESRWLREHLPRYRFVRRAVSRFMPGETLDDALAAAKMLENASVGTLFTLLGENITEPAEATRVTEHYLRALQRIRERGLGTELSVKLTQLGLDLGKERCFRNLRRIIEQAGEHSAVWIDMEGSNYVDVTLEIFRQARQEHRNVGICLQAYLRRTERDLASLLPLGSAIRLVKGAYLEPPDRAFPKKKDVDENYFTLSAQMLSEPARAAGVRAAFATHDLQLIRRIVGYATTQAIRKESYEFQMLYGVQQPEQYRLAHEGWKSLVLIAYGPYWFPWYMRRLAERPANAWFVVRNLLSNGRAPGFAEHFFKANEFLLRSANFASFHEAWMNPKISRRQMLKNAAASASSLALAKLPGLPSASHCASSAANTATSPTDERILPLTSTSGVFTPPRGGGFFKFSFDFPEPSVSFEGFQIAFRLYSFENTYTLDRNLMTVEDRPDGLHLWSSGLIWAGGQEKAPGQAHAWFRKNGAFIEWDVRAEMDRPIKSVGAIIRGVPRGKIAAGGGGLFDPRDNELLFGYPFGAGALFVARGMDSPVAVVQSGERDYLFLSALLDRVRANRFYFQPGENGYRVELIYEPGGWEKNHHLQSPVWRIGRASSLEEAYRPHFEHVESAFGLPTWETRADVPAWFRKIALVLAVHAMHWTGYIFNDFAKTLRILEWVKTQIPAENVLVFLPAWDGRYYWNYPIYKADPRLGGEDGFRALIHKGQSFGFRFMPMFGLNSANRELSVFSKFSDAATSQIDGDAFNLNWVDWDNDRHNEGWASYMNIGVESWRQWLFARIVDTIERYGVDAYFLDIAGGWENNRRADMHEGLKRLVGDLRKRFPNVLCCGEMSYDALLSFIPLYHVLPAQGYPGSFMKHARAFQHLSHPAPGRGSSGVHESGFGRFDPKTLSLNPRQIPTITVVDDTFDRYREVLTEIIAQAKQRAGIT